MGGHAPAIWFSHHLLAAAETMVGRRDVGADLRALLSRMDAEEKIEWAQALLNGRFVPAKKGETGLEKPRWAREPRL